MGGLLVYTLCMQNDIASSELVKFGNIISIGLCFMFFLSIQWFLSVGKPANLEYFFECWIEFTRHHYYYFRRKKISFSTQHFFINESFNFNFCNVLKLGPPEYYKVRGCKRTSCHQSDSCVLGEEGCYIWMPHYLCCIMFVLKGGNCWKQKPTN